MYAYNRIGTKSGKRKNIFTVIKTGGSDELEILMSDESISEGLRKFHAIIATKIDFFYINIEFLLSRVFPN